MSKSDKRIQAVELRRQGLSVKEVAQRLGVSSSSASIWLRDIVLTQKQKDLLLRRMFERGHKGRLMGAAVNRDKKVQALKDAQTWAKMYLSKVGRRDLFLLGLGLYWGEGVKSLNSALAIVNSDPRVIKVAKLWFEKCLDVNPERFCPRVFINATHKDREGVLLKFWSEYLEISSTRFARMVFIKREHKKVYENRDTYYGVLALRVAKGAYLRYRILALIEQLATAGVAQW